MTQLYPQILVGIDTVRRSWRARRAVEGVLATGAICVLMLTLVTLLDHVIDFGVFGRIVLALAFWASVVLSLLRYVAPPMLAVHGDDYFAAMMEQRDPSLGNRLINALQLGRPEASPAVPPRLAEAIVADGAAAIDEFDPASAVRDAVLKRCAMALAVSVLIAAAYFTLAGPGATTALGRIMMPFADIPPFTWTTVTLDDGLPDRVLEGSNVEITASITRGGATHATLHWREVDGRERAMRMTPAGADRFGFTLGPVGRTLDYHVTAGDGRTRTATLAVDPRPRIERIDLTLHHPAYTAREPQRIEASDGHIQALPQTRVTLNVHVSKPLESMAFAIDGEPVRAMQTAGGDTQWTIDHTVTANGVYTFTMLDTQGYEVSAPQRYTISLAHDAAPRVAFSQPARHMQVRPDEGVHFEIVAEDDLGIGPVMLMGRVDDGEPVVLHGWPTEGAPQRRVTHALSRSIESLGLVGGQRLQYWAVTEDRNDIAAAPGRAESRRWDLYVLTIDQAQAAMDRQLTDYEKALRGLLRDQQRNRLETASLKPAIGLLDLQGRIRRATRQLADVMQRNGFPAVTIIEELRELAGDEMVRVIGSLERYRDATTLDAGRPHAQASLPVQDEIIAAFEAMLARVSRQQTVRQRLKKLEREDPQAAEQVTLTLERLSQDLDRFLIEQHELKEKFEKLPPREEQLTGEDLAALDDIRHRLDRWKKWSKDSVDDITKLPQGFVQDSALADEVGAIFEEIEKKEKGPGGAQEIATPIEEGAKAIGTEVKEDLEVWSPDQGDSVAWNMENPPEGVFEVPEFKLPDQLQDQIGDLIEDVEEFDEDADDATSSWGGNLEQAGWDIADGPISTFNAVGKTGNQMPNESEITGRSGGGRRGKTTGQMVGSESNAYEGRPTPARLTNEPYEQGVPEAGKQLDPRGATGGGKKTGGGPRGLQGGNKPDFVKDMERLAEHQKLLREETEKLARDLQAAGRSSLNVDRAMELMDGAEQDYRDLRYDDAARKRKLALHELRTAQSQLDQNVSLMLQRAEHLPAEMREQISSGAQQALPAGYEDLVGAYYRALSSESDE